MIDATNSDECERLRRKLAVAIGQRNRWLYSFINTNGFTEAQAEEQVKIEDELLDMIGGANG